MVDVIKNQLVQLLRDRLSLARSVSSVCQVSIIPSISTAYLSHTHLTTSVLALPQIFFLGLPRVIRLRVYLLEVDQQRHSPLPPREQRDFHLVEKKLLAH